MLQEVEDILQKYHQEEAKIEQVLIEKTGDLSEGRVSKWERNRRGIGDGNIPSFDQAKERNRGILKELETVKGNLRSKAIFSPTEMQWEKICKKYQEEPSLQVTTWRCNLPVFV